MTLANRVEVLTRVDLLVSQRLEGGDLRRQTVIRD
jgi:hypothetical protein